MSSTRSRRRRRSKWLKREALNTPYWFFVVAGVVLAGIIGVIVMHSLQ